MKIACQENLVPGRNLKEKLDNLEKYGYDGVEIWGSGIVDRQDEIIKATENHKVKPSTVCAGYRGSLLDSNRSERENALSDMKSLLKVAANIGAVGLIMVPIFGGPKVPDLSPYKTARQLEEELLVALLKELGDYAKEVESYVLVEPLNRYETHFLNRLDQTVEICKKSGSPNVKLMADFFHMSIEEEEIAKSLKAAGDYVQHAHLADSTRLLPGYGHTDFKSGFAALKDIGFKNYMALECGIRGDREVELPKAAKYLRSCM